MNGPFPYGDRSGSDPCGGSKEKLKYIVRAYLCICNYIYALMHSPYIYILPPQHDTPSSTIMYSARASIRLRSIPIGRGISTTSTRESAVAEVQAARAYCLSLLR